MEGMKETYNPLIYGYTGGFVESANVFTARPCF